MKKELKEIIKESRRSLEKIEKNVEENSENFTEEVNEFWSDLKKHISDIEEKLDNAYSHIEDQTELKGHLAMMEIRDKMENFKGVAEEFTSKVSTQAQKDLDIASLKTHLLKMDSEDLWEKKQKDISLLYESSKEEAEKLALKAAKEFNQIFLKLTEII